MSTAKTPKSTNSAPTGAPPSAPTYDPGLGESAFEELLPFYRKLSEAELENTNVDIEAAAIVALGVARRVNSGELHAQFAALDGRGFDLTHVKVFEKAAWAAWYTARE